MTNAELIAELRGHIREVPLTLLNDAANALEADEQRIAIVEEERDLERFAAKNYLDKIDELEAQMPKEGEWELTQNGIDNCSVYKCSVCGSLWYGVGGYIYCPNCGARMQTVTDCHTLDQKEKGE